MYFISNTLPLYLGDSFVCTCLQQKDQTPNAELERVETSIQMPAAASIYYSGNATIDQHNCICQQQLKFEKKLQVRIWDCRVNLSILGFNNVDTYNFGKAMGWWSYDPNTFINA